MKLYNKIILAFLLPLVMLLMKPVRTQELEIVKPSFEQEITRIFGTKAHIALAVFEHESHNKLNAINYNCRYNGKSTFCKKGDEKKAWSVDCSIGQINVKGQSCPAELMTEEGQIKAIEKIYKQQGLKAWVSFVNGKYKSYL